MKTISIIMPVLNEESELPHSLSKISLGRYEELIVVDGGSTDRTVEIARGFTSRVYSCSKGRARQMNHGADRAEGEILLFLHADCLLPQGAFELIRKTLSDSKTILGAFDIRYREKGLCYRVIESGANLRSRMTSVPYGDQGMFIRREDFQRLGGFREIPLMEDIEFGRRAKRQGKVVFLKAPLTVSARRFQKEGILYGALRDWVLALSYTLFGVNPERLVRHYRDVR